MKESYYRYWGKTAPSISASPKIHLLPYHCLDVAACGEVLIRSSEALREHLEHCAGIPPALLQRLITTTLALHDIGKFSARFQSLVPELPLMLGAEKSDRPYSVRHDTLGYILLQATFEQNGDFRPALLFRDCDSYDFWDVVSPWLRAVTGHHGQPPVDPQSPAQELSDQFTSRNIMDAYDFWRAVEVLFGACSFPSDLFLRYEESRKRMAQLSWILAGLSVLADWLGSNREFFDFVDTQMDLREYYVRHAIPQAEKAIRESGLHRSSPHKTVDPGRLVLKDREPSPLQRVAIEEKIAQGPQLFIVEDMTGAGKTEAALILTLRLIQQGVGRGFFFGLPTMATSNAMYDRIGPVYPGMFEEESAPTFVLAHSAAKFQDRFLSSVSRSKESSSVYGTDEPTAEAFCTAWLADTSKKAMLADVGVGTIDQALLGVLPRKYQSLRLFGLLQKVVIIDEVHAYDEYTRQLISSLIEYQAMNNGAVILLSATLPAVVRTELINAFAGGIKKNLSFSTEGAGYPLLTIASPEGVHAIEIGTREGLEREVEIQAISDEETVYRVLDERAAAGQCVCWIRNTVTDAIMAYQEYRRRYPHRDVTLFHSRFIFDDRYRIEKFIIDSFGVKSGALNRAGKVVIATQVIEQSLDVDFDYLVTDLAPIDLVLQRLGRLRRHSRSRDGTRIETEERGPIILGIYGPAMDSDPNESWYSATFPRARYVYEDHAKLWLGFKELLSRKSIRLPRDARGLIEAVYGNEVEPPEGLKRLQLVAEGKEKSKSQLGALGVLKLASGYQRGLEWTSDDIVGTRLGDLGIEIRLGQWKGSMLMPLSQEGEYAWVRSSVRVPKHKIREAEKPTNVDQLVALRTVQEEPVNRFATLLPLINKEGQLYARASDEHGKTTQICYSHEVGLYFLDGEK